MSRQRLVSRIAIRWRIIQNAPLAQLSVGFGAFVLIVLLGLALGYKPTIWNDRGFGPGWECQYFGKGAFWCAKDVPPEFQQPNPR